jgi:hypothetical protein
MNKNNVLNILRYICLMCVLIIGLAAITGSGGGGYEPEPFWMYWSVKIADLNKDGHQDIAGSRGYFSTSAWQGGVSVLYQDSQNQGSFPFVERVKTGGLPYCISLDIGDLNGDRLEDVATACTFHQASNNISIIYQDSIITGEFLPSKNINIGFTPDILKIGDLNDDGFNDIVISGSNTSILYQDSNSPGTYLPIFSLNIDSSSVDIGDINGDSYLDLALAGEGQIRLLFQDPSSPGNFLLPLSLTSDLRPYLIKFKDIDNDGNLDLIVGNVQNFVSVFIQDPLAAGEFLQRDDYPLNRDVDDLAIGDLNNDGLEDIAVANGYTGGDSNGSIAILFQDISSIGNFLSPVFYPGIFQPTSIAIGDLNGDSFNDIVFADGGLAIRFQDPTNPGSFKKIIVVDD